MLLRKDNVRRWVAALPASRMVYPEPIIDRAKYFFWRLYTPWHPYFRDTLLTLRVLRHEGRQDFLIGKIQPTYHFEDVVSYLIEKGYANHFVAWKDEGELVSLRYVRDFIYQYHVRIFEDGEVRGHYEYTPECHPIWHLCQTDMQDRRAEFLALLQNHVIPYTEIEQQPFALREQSEAVS